MTVRAITRLVHHTLALSSSVFCSQINSALFLERYVLLSVLNLFCLQPSSRIDELPDDFDPSGRPGSFDDGDPQTTNLYVGNLSPKVFFLFLLGFMCCFLSPMFLDIHMV